LGLGKGWAGTKQTGDEKERMKKFFHGYLPLLVHGWGKLTPAHAIFAK
jgi:hypothetical protein